MSQERHEVCRYTSPVGRAGPPRAPERCPGSRARERQPGTHCHAPPPCPSPSSTRSSASCSTPCSPATNPNSGFKPRSWPSPIGPTYLIPKGSPTETRFQFEVEVVADDVSPFHSNHTIKVLRDGPQRSEL